MENIPKILIGCPTYDGHAHCIQRFIESLKNLSYKNFDVLFVDNSLQDSYAKLISDAGYEVLRNPASGERIVNIINNRNLVIQRALEKKYDYLFFVDTDILLPVGAIEKLLAVDQPVVSGVYLGGLKIGNDVKIAPVLYDFSEREDYVKLFPMNDVLDDLVLAVAACGFGCCLVRADVLEKVKLRFSEKTMSGEDVLFCHDARNLGYKIFANTGVKCTHIASSGDIEFPAGVANFSFETEIY